MLTSRQPLASLPYDIGHCGLGNACPPLTVEMSHKICLRDSRVVHTKLANNLFLFKCESATSCWCHGGCRQSNGRQSKGIKELELSAIFFLGMPLLIIAINYPISNKESL